MANSLAFALPTSFLYGGLQFADKISVTWRAFYGPGEMATFRAFVAADDNENSPDFELPPTSGPLTLFASRALNLTDGGEVPYLQVLGVAGRGVLLPIFDAGD